MDNDIALVEVTPEIRSWRVALGWAAYIVGLLAAQQYSDYRFWRLRRRTAHMLNRVMDETTGAPSGGVVRSALVLFLDALGDRKVSGEVIHSFLSSIAATEEELVARLTIMLRCNEAGEALCLLLSGGGRDAGERSPFEAVRMGGGGDQCRVSLGTVLQAGELLVKWEKLDPSLRVSEKGILSWWARSCAGEDVPLEVFSANMELVLRSIGRREEALV